MIKADLHMRGSLEFRKDKPVLDLILKQCSTKEIGICAINSEGYIEDKFGRLKSEVSGNYDVNELGNDVLAFRFEDKRVYLVNSQISKYKTDGLEIDHLMIGRNRLNFTGLEAALNFGEKQGLVQIAVNPEILNKNGARALAKYDCIEAYSAERCLVLPFHSGKLEELNKDWDDRCFEIGMEYGISRIATSGARSVKRLGNGYISLGENEIDYSSQESFLGSLKRNLKERKFTNYGNASSMIRVLATQLRL